MEIIQLLLTYGANPAMEVNRYGDTQVSALSFAKSGQRMFITEYFIQKGYIKWSDVKIEGCHEFRKIKSVNAPSGLTVRSAPSLKAPILGKLENGTEVKTCDIPYGGSVEVEGIKGTWNFIRYDGKDGFVFNGFLR
ncbi:MAG: SH3 domain-containing protein [Saprospiraceae bacterium]|nr:SH3 domain-containing protein [Saprospiraceae bacterium]